MYKPCNVTLFERKYCYFTFSFCHINILSSVAECRNTFNWKSITADVLPSFLSFHTQRTTKIETTFVPEHAWLYFSFFTFLIYESKPFVNLIYSNDFKWDGFFTVVLITCITNTLWSSIVVYVLLLKLRWFTRVRMYCNIKIRMNWFLTSETLMWNRCCKHDVYLHYY